MLSLFFFFNDTATTEIYTLSLHDALPICPLRGCRPRLLPPPSGPPGDQQGRPDLRPRAPPRSGNRSGRGDPDRLREIGEHTSELQSRQYLVCRLLLEKKKK